MKYIRTKDGIYEYVDYDNECIIPMPIIKCKGRLTHCAECDIIKQADIIEEVCDEFVAEDKEYGHNIYSKQDLEIINKSYLKTFDAFYGAIWTDEGLIYKAKMKGILPNGDIDWELL